MSILTLMRHRFWDNAGLPLSGGKVYTYTAGTTNPIATYTDSTGSIANTNPIILDSKGEAGIWTSGMLKVNVTDTNGVQITGWPVDNIGSGVNSSVQVGSIVTSGLTVNTGKLLGRTTSSAGAVEEIAIGTGLSMTAGVLSNLSVSGGSGPLNAFSVVVANNAVTISLTPQSIDFRSATMNIGAVVNRTISSTITASIPTGATLGLTTGVLGNIIVFAIDIGGGAVELAFAVPANNPISFIDEDELITTISVSAGSTSVDTLYSTTARSNVPYRVIGYFSIVGPTAGNWIVAPSRVQPAGGTSILGEFIQATAGLMYQNIQSAAYSTAIIDIGAAIVHPTSDVTARTFTLSSLSVMPRSYGSCITFINQHGAGVVSIASVEPMYLAGTGATGTRTLAANGMCTAVWVAGSDWLISGVGLS